MSLKQVTPQTAQSSNSICSWLAVFPTPGHGSTTSSFHLTLLPMNTSPMSWPLKKLNKRCNFNQNVALTIALDVKPWNIIQSITTCKWNVTRQQNALWRVASARWWICASLYVILARLPWPSPWMYQEFHLGLCGSLLQHKSLPLWSWPSNDGTYTSSHPNRKLSLPSRAKPKTKSSQVPPFLLQS